MLTVIVPCSQCESIEKANAACSFTHIVRGSCHTAIGRIKRGHTGAQVVTLTDVAVRDAVCIDEMLYLIEEGIT